MGPCEFMSPKEREREYIHAQLLLTDELLHTYEPYDHPRVQAIRRAMKELYNDYHAGEVRE